MTLYYKVARGIASFILRILFKIRINGLENIDLNESFIIASNHTSNWDALVLVSIIPKQFTFLGKKELFKNRIFSFFLSNLGVIPVDRSKVDLSAVREIIKHLKKGDSVMMFPEGTRNKKVSREQLKDGVALIAIMSNKNIVPVKINSDFKLFSNIDIVFGDEIDTINLKKTVDKNILKKEMVDRIFIHLSND